MVKRIILRIEDMECPNCAMNLERIEDTLNGVLMAEASYKKAQLILEYDEAIVTETQIRAEVQKLGYQAR